MEAKGRSVYPPGRRSAEPHIIGGKCYLALNAKVVHPIGINSVKKKRSGQVKSSQVRSGPVDFQESTWKRRRQNDRSATKNESRGRDNK